MLLPRKSVIAASQTLFELCAKPNTRMPVNHSTEQNFKRTFTTVRKYLKNVLNSATQIQCFNKINIVEFFKNKGNLLSNIGGKIKAIKLPRKLKLDSNDSFQRWRKPLFVSCAAVGCYGVFSVARFSYRYTSEILSDQSFTVPSVEAATPNISRFNFIADVVQSAGPAVVFLEIKGEHPDSGRRITMSNGSGFLVRENGLILTSAHVVANKSKVTVKLQDGDVYQGIVTAVDPIYDLATVKIEPKTKLPFIPLGKSSEIRPGEFVVAMGSPLSLNNTVTSGIVSSSLRGSKELGLDNKNMQYIQTDAVISFGNSGGPLVNLDGKAIGINNLKIISGISFAIPADYAFAFLQEAERVMEKANKSSKPSYIASGKESTNKRRFMGITMLSLTPLLLNELKDRVADFPQLENGVYVHKVIVGSPAYEGGLHAGDIIIEINGKKIVTTADIYQEVEKEPRLRITAVRGNYLQKIKVTTEELF